MANLLNLMKTRILNRERKEDHATVVIMCLGNPGRKYARTRHNVGFWVGDELAKRLRLGWAEADLMLIADLVISGKRLVVIKPLTWMNRSGHAAAVAVRRLGKIHRFMVVYDDVDLEPGQIRIRPQGGSGGHRGMQSIIEALNTDNIERIRVGVGRPRSSSIDTADWVLSEPTGDDLELLTSAVFAAADAVECSLQDGIEFAMRKYN